ncbi:MAG: alpha-glycosidase [Lachnospiraceae bacterium]|nr:alpha-glycosidase [Lachnospiraceae bacterium]
MNQYAILHIPDSRYCFACGEKELVLRLRMAKEDEQAEVSLIYACKYDFSLKRRQEKMKICYSDRLFHYYEIRLQLEDVRLAYVFQIEEKGKIYFYSEDGVTETYHFEEGFYNFFQMPYINTNDIMEVVEWMRSAVFYQIFVDRFCQGDFEKDTGYITMQWGETPTPKNFAGGDIKGITEKLDYIKSLGVNAIYLTPVFESLSNHKYDISNYKKIDPQFGTIEDIKELVLKAHKKGMRIVLDAVFNHCSMEMAEFQDVLEKGKQSPYYNWFIIDGEFPDTEKMNYECFAACNYMPKLNTADKGVQDFLIDIALFWIREADIDGWRLDVSDEVSHEFWRRFRREVKAEKRDCVIIGENWHDAYPYLMGDQYDSIMNYAFTKACLDYFAREKFSAKEMAEKLSSNLMRNMEQVNFMMMNLLDSHDTHRFFSEVSKNKDKLLSALALEFIFPGAPCIYYGTEICTEGGYDPDSRRCFDWEEANWDMEVMGIVKELTALRDNPVLQYGSVHIFDEDEMLCVERIWQKRKISLWINLSQKERHIRLAESQMVTCSHMYEKNLQNNGFLIVEEQEG